MKKPGHGLFYKIAYQLVLFYERAAGHRKKSVGVYFGFYDKAAGRYIKTLNPGQKVEEKQREYYAGKLAEALFLFLCGGILSGALAVSIFGESRLIDGQYLLREEYGGGTRTEKLTAGIDGKKEAVEVQIQERKYLPEEAKKAMEEAKKEIPGKILGKNKSLEEVRDSLQLVSSLPGLPFTISWKTSQYEIINSNGKIVAEKIKEEGELVKLTALLEYGELESSLEFYVRVLPKEQMEEEKLRELLYEKLKESDEADSTGKYLCLPKRLGERDIVWKEKKSNIPIQIFFLAVLAGVLVFFAKDSELHKEVQKRDRQMLLDYPDIVSKLVLLLGAGMTLKAAWEKICLDYQESRRKRERRYAYEEMMTACYEMDSGVSQPAAFEHFGKRCRLTPYLKLASLLSQNVRMGAGGILKMLETEVSSAFEERKNSAKKLGEEASTKLLVPMFMMLGIVMAVLIFPAFLSFQI